MNYSSDIFFESIKKDFIDYLVSLSNGKVSLEEAKQIADRNLRPTDFADGSPLQHKSVKWLAANYLDIL